MTSQTDRRFVGTWLLVSCEHRLETGETTHPLGKSAKGILVYTAEGYMSGALMHETRKNFRSQDLFGGTQTERSDAASTYVHYAGRYQVEEKRVLHFVEMSLFPNWIGSRQQRFYRFYDDKMELSTNSFVSEGIKQTAHLLWKKAVCP